MVEEIEFNRLYRWLVGLTLDEEVWDPSTFGAHRDRFLNERMGRMFFERVVQFAEWRDLLSDEHFSVDGTLIRAWASIGTAFRLAIVRPRSTPMAGNRMPL